MGKLRESWKNELGGVAHHCWWKRHVRARQLGEETPSARVTAKGVLWPAAWEGTATVTEHGASIHFLQPPPSLVEILMLIWKGSVHGCCYFHSPLPPVLGAEGTEKVTWPMQLLSLEESGIATWRETPQHLLSS